MPKLLNGRRRRKRTVYVSPVKTTSGRLTVESNVEEPRVESNIEETQVEETLIPKRRGRKLKP